MNTMHVRLTPWAKQRIEAHAGRITKKAIRESLRDVPGTEFHTISNPVLGIPGGKVVTVAEALRSGFDQLEVRFNDDRDLAIVTMHPSGATIVR